MEKEVLEKINPQINIERKKGRRGIFIVVDGLDGVGKGVVERALIEYEQKLGRTTFDTISFSKAESKGLPELENFWNPPKRQYNTIITAEPTYTGIGKTIRFEIIAKNKRKYSAEIEIQSYSSDRLVQMKQVVIPALKNNLRVIQSRCCASTLTYQILRAEDENKNIEEIKKRILEHEGNKFQLDWAPDLLIIPQIKNIDELIERITNRKDFQKDDNSIFDNKNFQKRLNELYKSSWLKEIFESKGTVVKYLDAGISPEETRNQTAKIYKEFLENFKGE